MFRNTATPTLWLGGMKTQGSSSSAFLRLHREKLGTIELWLPREPALGGGVSDRKSRYPRASHYLGPQVLWRPVPVSSPGVPAPRRRSPRPEPLREPPVSGVGSGQVGTRGGRPGVRLELARAAQPSPTPHRPLPPGRSLRSLLRWTPWLRLGEGIEDRAPESECLWTGPRVSRMCCPFENTALSSQVPQLRLFCSFPIFSETDAEKQLETPWSRGSQTNGGFFFFPFEVWTGSHLLIL